MRHGVKSKLSVILLGLTGLSLGACATQETISPPCPEIYIVPEGAKLTRFQPGPGRDIIDVLHEEEIAGFAQGCEYDTDESGAGNLTVWVVPNIISTRGPANKTGNTDFEYVIAVTDSHKKVRQKEFKPVVLTYAQNMSRIQWQAPVPQGIVLPLAPGQSGLNYRIYLSLRLNRAELDYQRQTR